MLNPSASFESQKGSTAFDQDFTRRISGLLNPKDEDHRPVLTTQSDQPGDSVVARFHAPSEMQARRTTFTDPVSPTIPQSNKIDNLARRPSMLPLPTRPMTSSPSASNISSKANTSNDAVLSKTQTSDKDKSIRRRGLKLPSDSRRALPWLDGARNSALKRSPGPSKRLPGSFEIEADDQEDDKKSEKSSTGLLSNPTTAVNAHHSPKGSLKLPTLDPPAPLPPSRPVPVMKTPSDAPVFNPTWDSRPAIPLAIATEVMQRPSAGHSPTSSKAASPSTTHSTRWRDHQPQSQVWGVKSSSKHQSRSMSGPVADLENLMQQAVSLASEAEKVGQTDEARKVLDEANFAAGHASRVQEHQDMASDVFRAHKRDAAESEDSDNSSTFSSDSSMSRPSPAVTPLKQMDRVPQALDQNVSSLNLPEPAELGHQSLVRDWAYGQSVMDKGRVQSGLRSPFNAPTATEETIRRPRFEGNESDVSLANGPRSRVFGSLTANGGGRNWGRDKYDEKDYVSSEALKGKHHYTLSDHQHFSIHHHRRQPIARNWGLIRKRTTAVIACLNTALIGVLIGIYAGEVPAIQYALTDTRHMVALGNTVLYVAMALSTMFTWSLPLLHGRKPYTVLGLALILPLQIPQAAIVARNRDPNNSGYRIGLLVSRALQGLAMGLVHINTNAVLMDLFGASLQSEFPHGEIVIVDDVRRHGGGIGIWLGWWSFCFVGSLALGFLIGAGIISHSADVSWGFYVSVIFTGVILLLNILAPETRRAPHRRTLAEVLLPNMNVARRVARGEISMHVKGDGPKYWWEEVSASLYLCWRMIAQVGFSLMTLYLGWIYGQIILIIVLLGNLLSVNYRWLPYEVGWGVFSIAVGGLLAVPDTKANFFSRARTHPQRTDSMTFAPRISWTSHLVRRTAFMTLLPLAGMAYTLSSSGKKTHYMAPIIFAGVIGYVTVLAIAECHGVIMETYDTCDLQPGVNSRHRLQSLAPAVRKRRTTYSSYPRVSAGLIAAQTTGFLLAAAATGVGGVLTRAVGAQKATGMVAGTLFGLTLLLTTSLWRWKKVQVIPNDLFGGGAPFGGNKRTSMASMQSDRSWRAVIIGNPSGKYRRMSTLELGGLSRWTEIRRLNRLLNRTTTQPLNAGWR